LRADSHLGELFGTGEVVVIQVANLCKFFFGINEVAGFSSLIGSALILAVTCSLIISVFT
jgi:hypothetical protein